MAKDLKRNQGAVQTMLPHSVFASRLQPSHIPRFLQVIAKAPATQLHCYHIECSYYSMCIEPILSEFVRTAF